MKWVVGDCCIVLKACVIGDTIIKEGAYEVLGVESGILSLIIGDYSVDVEDCKLVSKLRIPYKENKPKRTYVIKRIKHIISKLSLNSISSKNIYVLVLILVPIILLILVMYLKGTLFALIPLVLYTINGYIIARYINRYISIIDSTVNRLPMVVPRNSIGSNYNLIRFKRELRVITFVKCILTFICLKSIVLIYLGIEVVDRVGYLSRLVCFILYMLLLILFVVELILSFSSLDVLGES